MSVLGEMYRSKLMLLLRTYDVPRERIADALVKAEEYIARTGEDPVVAFGTPRALAGRLASKFDVEPSPYRLVFRPGVVLLVALALLTVEFATAPIFDAGSVVFTVAEVVGMGWMLALMLFAMYLGIRAATHPRRRARAWSVVLAFIVVFTMPITTETVGWWLGSQARVLALPAAGSVGLAVACVVLIVTVLAVATRPTLPFAQA